MATDSTGSKQSPGQIEAWNGGAKFVVEDSPKGGAGGKTPAKAVFKGLAEATTPKAGPELFAADVANARVDVFNSNFAPMKTPGRVPRPEAPEGLRAVRHPGAGRQDLRRLRQAEQAEDRRGPGRRPGRRGRLQRQRQAAAPPGQQRRLAVRWTSRGAWPSPPRGSVLSPVTCWSGTWGMAGSTRSTPPRASTRARSTPPRAPRSRSPACGESRSATRRSAGRSPWYSARARMPTTTASSASSPRTRAPAAVAGVPDR